MYNANILRLFLLTGLLFSFGPASNNKGKIEGTKWSSMASTIKGQFLPAGILKLDFKNDGSVVYTAGLQKFTGKFFLNSGDEVTLKLDQKLAGRKTHRQKVVIRNNQLTMTDSDGTAMTFERVAVPNRRDRR